MAQQKMKNNKQNIKYIVIIVLVLLCVFFSKNIRYFFNADNDIVISEPHGFYFEIMNKGNGDLYEIDGLNDTTYITVDKKYLNNDDAHVYVTGSYWNSPDIPLVKINGKVVEGVSSENSGHVGSVFNDVYYSKIYYFNINETLEENKKYTIYVRIKNISKSINVIFTTQKTEDGILVDDESV